MSKRMAIVSEQPRVPSVRLHGGAERLPVRWRGDDQSSNVTCSWYGVAPGEQCTRHVHSGKTETWLLVAGTAEVELGGVTYRASAGDAFVAPPGTPYALVNAGTETVVFVNIVERVPGAPTTTTEFQGVAP